MVDGSVWMMLGIAAGMAVSAATAGETELEQTVARGVYWPWERTQANADAAGKELWQFTDELMGFLRNDLHCNVIWFVNGPGEPDRACALAAKHDLKVLCGVLGHQIAHGITDVQAMTEAARAQAGLIKASPALGAYVLKDEPLVNEVEHVESLRRIMHAVDPAHPSIVVTMTHHTEPYARRTGLPIICTDIYHFGGPRSPNIPNPATVSVRTYRGCIEALAAMTSASRKTAWAMPMAFADPRGPWWRDPDGNVVLEPGCYWHWRMPTVAEMHWQTWEALRGGCRGVVYYVLLPPANSWTPEQGPPTDRMRKYAARAEAANWPLVQERIATGQPSDLLLPGGRPTPQSRALGADFALVEKLDAVLHTTRPAVIPSVFADRPAAVATFRRPEEPDVRYCVVVNDDLQAAQALSLSFLPNVVTAINLADDAALTLKPEAVGSEALLDGQLLLDPGMGTVLRLECRPDSQLALFSENFSGQNLGAKLDGAGRQLERRGFAMGAAWRVRKTGTCDEDGRVTPNGGKPVANALRDASKGRTTVYLMADGWFHEAESLVVSFKDKDDNGGWHKTVEHHRPVAIPPDTATIELLLRTEDAALTGVRIWRVDTLEAP